MCHYANVQTEDMQNKVSIQREVCTYYGCPLMAPVHIPYKLCPMLDKKIELISKIDNIRFSTSTMGTQ